MLVHEKIFDIINRQGDMNQNYSEIPLPLLGWLEPKRQVIKGVDEAVERLEPHLFITDEDIKSGICFGEQLGSSSND